MHTPLVGASADGVQVKGIGGYHTVTLPVDQETKDAMMRMKSGQVNWIELVSF